MINFEFQENKSCILQVSTIQNGSNMPSSTLMDHPQMPTLNKRLKKPHSPLEGQKKLKPNIPQLAFIGDLTGAFPGNDNGVGGLIGVVSGGENGATTGARTGTFTGETIGAFTGADIGDTTGLIRGDFVGGRIGAVCGGDNGATTGARTGTFTGETIGAFTGTDIGDTTGAFVMIQVSKNLRLME